MEINVSDYFSESQVAEMVEQEFRSLIRTRVLADQNMLIVNGIYEAVAGIVNELIEDAPEMRDSIVANTNRVISELSGYNVFRKPDAWSARRGEKDTVGQVLLEAAVQDQKDKIGRKVEGLISDLGFSSIRDLVVDSVRASFDANEETE